MFASMPGAEGAAPVEISAPEPAAQAKSVRVINVAASRETAPKRVAAYARVSMDTEELLRSASAQVSYYSNLIQNTPGWLYAGVFADEGISGTSTNRPEFRRMLAECEAGKIDVILTKSISRFARNTVDLLTTVRRLKMLDIEVRFEREKINSLSEDGELMLTLLASFAQEESLSISTNCKWGIQKSYERGKIRLRAMYGYRVVDGKLVIEEREAEVIRRIFRMYLDGCSCYGIAQRLNDEGIRSFRGNDFCGHGIAFMLRQEKYIGCTLCQKYYVENHITHRELRNNGEMPMYFVEDSHPAIIRREVFQDVQEEIARREGVEIKNGIAGVGNRKSGRGKLPMKIEGRGE